VVYGGAVLTPDSYFHLARCGDTPTSPACQWSCQIDQFSNPVCANQNETCALTSGQVLATLKGRAAFRVNDATCSSGPDPHTRVSLRIEPPGGADFSIPDRLANLCGVSVLCGPCDPDSGCTDQDTSCPLDPVFMCDAFGFTGWSEAVLQGTAGIGLELWLNFYQVIPPSMTADIVAQLPSLPADAVPVIVGAREIFSAAVDDDPVDGSSKREYCLNIWVITLPDPGRTTLIDLPGSTSASLLADMGSCGCGDGLLDLGEECDDGNTSAGDGCDATCRREACWTCSGQPSFCQQSTPRTQCRGRTQALKGLLLIKDKPKDEADLVKWNWIKGEETLDFGDPLDTDEYDLCIYHDDGSQPLLFGARAPAGGTCDGKPCWVTKDNGTSKYLNKAGTPSGMRKVVLVPGADGKAKILTLGKGIELTLPSLPLPLPALAQLQRIGQPDCWETTFSTTGQIANDTEMFKGKPD
jgi:cysteine-rich repeat protein